MRIPLLEKPALYGELLNNLATKSCEYKQLFDVVL